MLPYWHESLAPAIKAGRKVVVAAHGNSLRALVKHLDNISDEDIVALNIPNGVPPVHEFDDQIRPLGHYFLGDAEALAGQLARKGGV